MHALGHYTTNDGGQSSSILKEKLDLWKMSLTFIFFFEANWVENIPSLFSVLEKVMNLPEGMNI